MTGPRPGGGKALELLGGGEHARVVQDTATRSGWLTVGCWTLGDSQPGLVHLGGDADLLRPDRGPLAERRFHLALVGQPGSTLRNRLLAWGDDHGLPWATVVHPSALLGWGAELGAGCFLGPRAVLNPFVRLEAQVVVNTGAILEHDVAVGRGSHLAPGAVIGGGTRIGAFATIGLGACVRDHVVIGDHCVVGMGAVVLEDLPPGAWVAGNPARALGRKG